MSTYQFVSYAPYDRDSIVVSIRRYDTNNYYYGEVTWVPYKEGSNVPPSFEMVASDIGAQELHKKLNKWPEEVLELQRANEYLVRENESLRKMLNILNNQGGRQWENQVPKASHFPV